jgi:hypothetical protein
VDHNPSAGLNAPVVALTSSPSSICINVGGLGALQFLFYYGQY